MSEHRNFWERLLKKTTKEVFEKDRAGKIIGKKTYQYDKQGGLVCCTESSYDEAGKCFLKKKTKTYKRDASDQYDPEQTIYYDDRERPITQKNYSRDASDLLCCDQIKYTYAKI